MGRQGLQTPGIPVRGGLLKNLQRRSVSMKITEVMKKLLAIALSLCMLFQYVPVTAFAAAENGLCEHHSVHTNECG